MPSNPPASRRALLIRSAGLIAATAVPAWLTPSLAQGVSLRPTPSQSEGPFYPVKLPTDSDFDLLHNKNSAGAARYAQGEATWVEGTVLDTRGVPVAGSLVEIWQCDQDGHYHHPADGGKANPAFQGFGRVAVGKDGAYRFRTLRPARYGGRTPHIHVKVKLDGLDLLTTQLYVKDDPGNAGDFLWRRLDERAQAAITVPFAPSSDGFRARFPIVVQA